MLMPLALTCWSTVAGAAEDLLIDDFTDPASAASTVKYWGNAIQTYEHDATQDAGGNASSGALKVIVQYDLVTHGGENQFSARREIAGAPIDGSLYGTLEFDIKYDAASVSQGTSGNYGNLEVGITHTDWSNYYFGTIQTNVGDNGWRHVSLPVDDKDAKLNLLRDFHFKQWSGGANDGMTGTQTFWIDNVKLVALPDNAPPPPPPTVTVQEAKPGLNLISSGAGQYNRQTVRTVSPEYSWADATTFPVTYSLTISDYTTQPNHQSMMYFVPGSGLAVGLSDPDWNRPIVAVAFIGNNANGGGFMRFAYKNDVAGSNGYAGHDYWSNDNPADLYDAAGPGTEGTGKGGTLATVGSASMVGKWSVTFTSKTEVTVTSPDGNTGSGTFPNEATAALFAGPMYVYFGTVPNEVANIGQSAIFSRVEISGVGEPLDENFSVLPLNPLLEKSASDPAGVVVVSAETPFWLGWTLPAVGFVPQYSPNLGAGDLTPWADIGIADAFTANGVRRKLLNITEVPDSSRNFFRMAKP